MPAGLGENLQVAQLERELYAKKLMKWLIGLALLFPVLMLADGFVFLSKRMVTRYFPDNDKTTRLAPVILGVVVVVVSNAIAEAYKANTWWTALSFAVPMGLVGRFLLAKARQEAEAAWLQEEESRRLEQLASLQRAKELYQQYEANPHSLFHPDFREEFKRYWDWDIIKSEVIRVWRQSNNRCNCCGRLLRGSKHIHVDHIRPRSKYPHLRYLKSNLQVLCDRCNRHKHDYDGEDWRKVVGERKKAHAKRRRIRQQRGEKPNSRE